MSKELEQRKRPLDEAITLARTVLPQEPSEVSTLDVYAFQMFTRTIRLADGAAILLKSHLAEEALCLGRSMFEDSLRMADLSRLKLDPASFSAGLWRHFKRRAV